MGGGIELLLQPFYCVFNESYLLYLAMFATSYPELRESRIIESTCYISDKLLFSPPLLEIRVWVRAKNYSDLVLTYCMNLS